MNCNFAVVRNTKEMKCNSVALSLELQWLMINSGYLVLDSRSYELMKLVHNKAVIFQLLRFLLESSEEKISVELIALCINIAMNQKNTQVICNCNHVWKLRQPQDIL